MLHKINREFLVEKYGIENLFNLTEIEHLINKK